jgi:hypothetical protein
MSLNQNPLLNSEAWPAFCYVPAERPVISDKLVSHVELLMYVDRLARLGRVVDLSTEEKMAISRACFRTRWIYFVMDRVACKVMIGSTDSLDRRINTLNTMLPNGVDTLVLVRYTPDLEQAVKRVFSESLCHGSWYNLSDDLLQLMECADNQGAGGALAALELLAHREDVAA